MLKEIAIGLAVLLATGITVLAYRHPNAYKAIWRYLFILGVGPAIGWLFTFITNPYFALAGRLKFVEQGSTKAISLNADELRELVGSFESFFVYGLALIAIIIYLVFLRFLPSLIRAIDDET